MCFGNINECQFVTGPAGQVSVSACLSSSVVQGFIITPLIIEAGGGGSVSPCEMLWD